MDRIIKLPIELQPEGNSLGASADLVARDRTISDTLESADVIVRKLIASAGFSFDPLVVLA